MTTVVGVSGNRQSRVTIPLDDPELDRIGVFNAYTTGDNWNGFVVPYFTESEGKRIGAWSRLLREKTSRGEDETVEWDEERRAFIMKDPHYPHEAGAPIPSEDIIEGRWNEDAGEMVYGIGAYKWTWEIAEEGAIEALS